MMYPIEKDIPLPTARGRLYPFNDMQVGDSFAVPADKANSVRAEASRLSKGGKKFTVRTVRGITRCWRIA